MKPKNIKTILAGGVFVLAAVVGALVMGSAGRDGAVATASAADMMVYKSPTCGCCTVWIEHIEAHGFSVEYEDTYDIAPIKQANGITRELASCHTALIGGYVIEGHVPAEDIQRLLAERPDVVGLTVPGMPMGSPGMEGSFTERYDVLAYDRDGNTQVFATHN